ncbi:MAG: hypothetical protein KDK64_02310 [Chlamydiia bacterium]|nr:hypothetical protein [Chlamydiia bacterium]
MDIAPLQQTQQANPFSEFPPQYRFRTSQNSQTFAEIGKNLLELYLKSRNKELLPQIQCHLEQALTQNPYNLVVTEQLGVVYLIQAQFLKGLLKMYKLNTAKDLFCRVLEEEHTNIRVWEYLGKALLESGFLKGSLALRNLDAAEKCFKWIITLDPRNTYATRNLWRVYFAQASHSKAIK